MNHRNIPFGYTMENGTVVINDAEAAIIRETAEQYLGGKSLRTIAELLTAKRVEYMPGKSDWNRSRIQRMIDDKRYIGENGYVKRRGLPSRMTENYCRSYVRWRWTSRPPTAKR